MTAIPYPAHSELKGHFSEDPTGAGTRAVTAVEALRAAACRREKATLATASPPFPPVLCAGGGDRLPLHVRNRIGTAAAERHDMIFPIAGTGTARKPRGGAGMLALEFPRHGTGPMLSR